MKQPILKEKRIVVRLHSVVELWDQSSWLWFFEDQDSESSKDPLSYPARAQFGPQPVGLPYVTCSFGNSLGLRLHFMLNASDEWITQSFEQQNLAHALPSESLTNQFWTKTERLHSWGHFNGHIYKHLFVIMEQICRSHFTFVYLWEWNWPLLWSQAV